MALCFKQSDSLTSCKYTISNYAYKSRCYIGTKYIRSPCHILKLAPSPHNLTHPPPCWQWIRTFRKYGVMLPFSGITLQQNILKISELLPDLWWMVIRQYRAPCNPCLKNLFFLRINRVDILKEINVQVGRNLPCDSRSARRIFKIQFCYGIGCPVSWGLNVRCMLFSCPRK
jgi:hypothetical protein